METGNNPFPHSWVPFPDVKLIPKDQIILTIGKLDGVNFLLCSKTDKKPLGSVISMGFEDFISWFNSNSQEFSNSLLFGEEDFGAWYPKSWVDIQEEWLKPLDPEGNEWDRIVIESGMELHFRFPSTFPKNLNFVPLMAHNAERWLKTNDDSVRVHRNGNRMEMAVIKDKSIQLHTIFRVESSNEAAYNCLLLYDQCAIHTEYVPLVWEGEMDELAWEKLRPFIKKIDTSSSHPWSALSCLI